MSLQPIESDKAKAVARFYDENIDKTYKTLDQPPFWMTSLDISCQNIQP